jgi:hypothetical protein
MEMYGIRLVNSTTNNAGGGAARIAAEFTAFAALCWHYGFAPCVRGVEFVGPTKGYLIDVDRCFENTEIGGGIEFAADATLPRFVIFGRVEHKGGLNDLPPD